MSLLIRSAVVVSFLSVATNGAAAAQHRYVLADSNEARDRVKEQLVGFDLPNDAVGKTSQIQGGIVIGSDGRIVREASRITVDLRTLTTDQQMRDNYVRRNVFRTDSFPTADFVPTEVKGVSLPLPAAGPHTFDLIGELTLRGVTRPTTWAVTARRVGDAIVGTATTRFKFADF
ncbi:MAG TPA: YceI family protein, partial [Longimicrobiales bacterium]|nr:YceI family protein [Longimicrobiales bacterium]